ncbi:MAG: RNA polymerase sigma factor [Pyrinomonadaceae bacterium]
MNSTVLDTEAMSVPNTGELVVRADRTDNQLVELVLAGETTAFEQLFDRHKRMVAGLASRYFRRHEDIEELVQASFAKAYTELRKFNGKYDRSFASWLGRITINTCFDALRVKRRRPETLDCELGDEESITLIESLSHDSGHTDDVQTRDLADKLLSNLAPQDRALLEMLYTDEMSVAEISEVLGTSQSNVKVRAWRARRQLRKLAGKLM